MFGGGGGEQGGGEFGAGDQGVGEVAGWQVGDC